MATGSHRPHRRRPTPDHGPGRRFLRGLSGLCAGGLVVLAVGLVVIRVVLGATSLPGPTGSTLVGHLGFAAAAVGAQVVADREDSRRGTIASVVVLLVTLVVLWVWWWR